MSLISYQGGAAAVLALILIIAIDLATNSSEISITAKVHGPIKRKILSFGCTSMHVASEWETCESIAKHVNISVPEFKAMNPELNCDISIRGATICLSQKSSRARAVISATAAQNVSASLQLPGNQTLTHSRAMAASSRCFCSYDDDWNVWALASPRCKAGLYARCSHSKPPAKASAKQRSLLAAKKPAPPQHGLLCSWLDQYYMPAPALLRPPFELQISAYLYQECPRQPPCECASIQFADDDPPEQFFKCCHQLDIWCQIPYSGLSCATVQATCHATPSKRKHTGTVRAKVAQLIKAHGSCGIPQIPHEVEK